MEYIVMGVLIGIAVVFGGIFLWKNRNNIGLHKITAIQKQALPLNHSEAIEDEMNQVMILFEQLSVEAIAEDAKLMEITDSKVLAHIDHLVPGLFQAGNTIGNAVQAVQTKGDVVYQAIIPAGVKLSNSKEIEGAVRGIYHGAGGISGHANLVAIKNNANVVSNVTSSAMGVASVVVGQYYMTQINAELGEINAGITKIADFQDNEYKSKVFALVAQIQKVAKFQVDILDNDELRLGEINNLNRWEQECIELLGQANLTIVGFSKKNDLDYNEYEKELGEAHNWFIYQKTLMEVMTKIAELKHILHLGTVSREQCGALLPIYSKQVQDTLTQLGSWHQVQVEKFKINVDENNRKRVGFDGFIHIIPSWINENQKYRAISDKTVKKIVTQTNGYEMPQKNDMIDLFQEDVRIIAKEGKIYYLPQE